MGSQRPAPPHARLCAGGRDSERPSLSPGGRCRLSNLGGGSWRRALLQPSYASLRGGGATRRVERVFLCACVRVFVHECVFVFSDACVGLGEGCGHAAASAILVVMVVITGVKSSKYCLCITSRGALTHTREAIYLPVGSEGNGAGGWIGRDGWRVCIR